MEKKGKLIFFLCNLIVLTSLFLIDTATAEPIQIEQEKDELFLYLYYDNEPHINEPTWIDCEVEAATDVTFSLELRIENSTDSLVIYENSSITLIYDSDQQWFYYTVEITFNKTEQWNIWLTATTTAAKVYDVQGQLQTSPFELYISTNYDAYAYYPTTIDISINYYGFGPQNISYAEVLLDDSFSNDSIYYNNSVPAFSGGPENIWDSFNYTITTTGYYQLWFRVYDGSKIWTVWNSFNVRWLEIRINCNDIFVENATTIDFEILSSIPSSINVDIYMNITWWFNDEDFNLGLYTKYSVPLDATFNRAGFTDSVYVPPYTFPNWGGHCHNIVLKAVDTTNDKETIQEYHFHVHEEVEILLEQDRELWLDESAGNKITTTMMLTIGYMGTEDVNISIELILDDGVSNTTLYYNASHSFFGVIPYSFDHDYDHEFYAKVDHTFTKIGDYNVWLVVRVSETDELLNYSHCWFKVKGKEFDPPIIVNVEGLTNGATYSGWIDIKVTMTEDSMMEYVRLLVSNENFSDSMDFDLSEESNYWYATLSLDTSNIFDGDYKAKVEAKDEYGNIGTVDFNIRFENGIIYIPPDEDKDFEEEDRITPGFEGLILILSILTLVGYSKHRK
ncbi:MAG: hypothetical protein ACFE95_01180 [Candidatus Hodarchaeota archaeon]